MERHKCLEKVAALPGQDHHARGAALYRSGELAWRQDEMGLSISLNGGILAIAEMQGDKPNMISLFGSLSRVALRQGDGLSAVRYGNQAVRITEEVGASRAMVTPLFMWANAAHNAGEDDGRATALLVDCMDLNEEFRLRRMIAIEN